MHFSATVLALLAAAESTLARPVVEGQIEKRQFGVGSSTENQLMDGQCADVVFIWARASGEGGNMGSSLGPPLCSDLQAAGNVICQGVGGAYSADIGSNTLPAGTSQGAIDEATTLFQLAASQCPNAKIVTGGYSQGTAVIFNSVMGLSSSIKNMVVGAVLFGYTKNQQNRGEIPNYPSQNTLVYCNADDGVCGGALAVTAGHFDYQGDVTPASQFLAQKAGI